MPVKRAFPTLKRIFPTKKTHGFVHFYTLYYLCDKLDTKMVMTQGQKKKSRWKAVALGQASGILLGAGILYAVRKKPADDVASDSDGHREADHAETVGVATVNDSLSFEKALAEAQAHVGDNGIFTWRGGIYATCDEQQWAAKTPEQREAVAAQVEAEISIEEMETEALATIEPDGFIHVTDGHGHDYVYVNNERIELSGGDEVSVVGAETADDEVGIISTFAATENTHVIHADDDMIALDDLENDHFADGEVIDLQTGEIYSQPVALVEQDDDMSEVVVLDDDNEIAPDEIAPDEIAPDEFALDGDPSSMDIRQMEALQMDLQSEDMTAGDDGVMDDGFFDPGPDGGMIFNNQ